MEFTSTEGFLPTTKAEATDPAFNNPDTKAFIALLPSAKFAPTITGWEDTAKAVIGCDAVDLPRQGPAGSSAECGGRKRRTSRSASNAERSARSDC